MNQPSEFESEKLALDNCEREPVHIPGRVQDFVAVVGISKSNFEIVCHSENCERIIGLSSQELLGAPCNEVFTNRKLVHGIRGALSIPSVQTQRERVGRFAIRPDDDTEFEVALSLGGELAILEFEPASGAIDRSSSAIFQVRTMLASLANDGGVEELLDSAVNALRKLTGFDRVMGYQFLPCGAGEVEAECCSPGVEPYLGLRYPASDIPRQVRALMVRQPFRMISDCNDPHSNLRSNSSDPVDLSLCHGRGVSPIHVEYLNNMGVCATANTSIIVRGELWGLFAFHHYRPRHIAPDIRLVCELFGQLFSMRIQQELEKEILSRRRRAASTRDSLKEGTKDTLDETFDTLWEDLAEIVDAHGMAIVRPQSVRCYGSVPAETVIRCLVESNSDPLFVSDNLSSVFDGFPATDFGKSAGALAMQISSTENTFAVFFRDEVIHEIRWAGKPVKEIQHGPNGPRLTQRGSFGEYSQTMKGKSESWTQFDLSAASELQSIILDVIYSDVTATTESWRKQKKYQDVLIAELSHRVKNVLALVRSISRQTKDSSSSLEKFTTSFEKRIGALATAHDLVGGSGVQWARIEDLVRSELKPFLNTLEQSIKFSGPSVGLRADVAPVIALVLHELMSNASKHGALSERKGKLEVSWKLKSGGLSIEWHETEIGKLTTPSERGFGLTLIERAVPYECKGEASISFHDGGLTVRLWIPSDATKALEPRETATKTIAEPSSQRLVNSLKKVIVVDDNMILAMEMEKTIKHLGGEQVESVPSVEAGIQLLELGSDYSLAILDINLGDSTSFELAQKLQELGIPVIFATGYDSKFDVPASLRHLEHLTKPIDNSALIAAIEKTLDQ